MTCYIAICGGLGNQLFQIAAAVSYSQRTNKRLKIFISSNERGFHWDRTLQNYKDLIVYTIPDGVTHFKESEFNYKEIPHIEGDIFITGYFQSSKYFNRSEDISLLKFVVESKDSLPENYIVVHARRGDYCQSEYMIALHNPQSDEYYVKAKEFIGSKIKNPKYILLSDDADYWVNSSVFKAEEREIINEDMYNTLAIIASGSNFIISNSSFAWWGVYFSKKKNLVIAPLKWFGPIYPYDWSSIYEDDWIKL